MKLMAPRRKPGGVITLKLKHKKNRLALGRLKEASKPEKSLIDLKTKVNPKPRILGGSPPKALREKKFYCR